jgi:hypothetical protein
MSIVDRSTNLDAFVKCEVGGCDWRILLGYRRCYQHRGPGGPQYKTDTDGAVVATKFMPREQDPDFDPLDAA